MLSALLGLLVLIEGQIIYSVNQDIMVKTNTIAHTNIPILNKAHKVKLAVVQVQQWLTDISATRGLDGLNDGFDEAENNAELFYTLISDLKSLDPARTDRYQKMNVAFTNYYDTGKKMAEAYVKDGPAAGNKLMASFDAAAERLDRKSVV